jgi:hypothetical protein
MPTGLLHAARPLRRVAKVSRSDTFSGIESTATLYRLASDQAGRRRGPAHAPQDHLLALHLQSHRRILRDQPGQTRGQLVLICLGPGDDGDRKQRLRHHPRLHQQWVVSVRESVARLGAGQLRHRANVPGDALGRGALGFAKRRGEGADPLIDVVVLVPSVAEEMPGHVDGHRAAGCRRRFDKADPAHVREGSSRPGDKRPSGIAGQWLARLAVRGRHGRNDAFDR